MTIVLDLPPDVEGALTRQAERQGTTPENLLLSDIRRLYSPAPDQDQRRRHTALAAIITRAQGVTPAPTALEESDPIDEAIVEKFRRQGFHL